MGEDRVDTDQQRTQQPAWLGMGALIGIGAGFGLVLGIFLQNVVLAMISGAAIGTVAGAIVETQRQRR